MPGFLGKALGGDGGDDEAPAGIGGGMLGKKVLANRGEESDGGGLGRGRGGGLRALAGGEDGPAVGGGAGLRGALRGGDGEETKPSDHAKDFMGKFVKTYLKSYGKAIILQAKDEQDGNFTKLQYRQWTSAERPDIFKGHCYLKQGAGPCAFKKWKPVFIVETNDYNIAVYDTEKSYKNGQKPKTLISTAGYALQDNPTEFYKDQLSATASDMGMSDDQVEAEAKFSEYSWALTHPWRANYVFQLHFIKQKSCSCMSAAVEPADAGSEFTELRQDYLKVFKQALLVNPDQNKRSVSGKAFELTVTKLVAKYDKLEDFKDDGTEAEILTDMILQYSLADERKRILFDGKGPAKLRLKRWHIKRRLIEKALFLISNPIWGTTQKAAQRLADKVGSKVGKGLLPLIKAKDNIKAKLQDKISDAMRESVDKHVNSYVQPLVDTFGTPMTRGFEFTKETFSKRVDISELPDDKNKRNAVLDAIPRSAEVVTKVAEVAGDVAKGLETLNEAHDNRFKHTDKDQIMADVVITILTPLDAAVHTLQCLVEDAGKSEDHKDKILEALDHDMAVVYGDFMRTVLPDILLPGLHQDLDPAVKPIVKSLDVQIPDDLADIVSLKAVYDDLCKLLVEKAVNTSVEKMFPKPTTTVEKLGKIPEAKQMGAGKSSEQSPAENGNNADTKV